MDRRRTQNLHALKIHCRSEPARDSSLSVTSMPHVPPPSRAGSLLHWIVVGHKICVRWRSTVRASLLAIALCQSHQCRMCCRHREQAHSYIGSSSNTKSSCAGDPLWE
ncbi:hypothetical protein EB795_01765 [Pseudomonas mandelii]|nr:hypothetical protein [Pseudomonas mandelii]